MKNKILYFDIETASQVKNLTKKYPLFNEFEWKNRDRDTCKVPTLTELKKIYKDKAALSPIYGKIVCISVGLLDGNQLRVVNLTGDEESIIRTFYSYCTKDKTLCVYNKGFDLPYIRVRALANEIAIPTHLNDSGKKPWNISMEPRAEVRLLDVMEQVKGIFFNPFSLQEVCGLLKIATSKGDLDGSQVSEAYHSGRIDDIAAYCAQDVRALAECHVKLDNINAGLPTQPIELTIVTPKQPVVYNNAVEEVYHKGSSDLEESDLTKLETKRQRDIYSDLIMAAKPKVKKERKARV